MVRDLVKKDTFHRYDVVGNNTIYLYLNEGNYEYNDDYYLADVYIITGNTEDHIKQWFITNYIEKYDSSSKVNQFKINDVTTWLSNTERMSRRASAEVLNSSGGTYNLILDDGSVIEINCSSFLIMLDKIEQYAIQTRLKTNEHIANVKALATIDDVLAYDYKAGYPTPLEFTILDKIVYEQENALISDDEYQDTKIYHKGDYCTNKGKLYLFIMDNGLGIPLNNPTYWEEVNYMDELKRLQNEINNINNKK